MIEFCTLILNLLLLSSSAALLFEKCELATQSINAFDSDPSLSAFNNEIGEFIEHQQKLGRPLLTDDPEVDSLVSWQNCLFCSVLSTFSFSFGFFSFLLQYTNKQSDDALHSGVSHSPARAGEGL